MRTIRLAALLALAIAGAGLVAPGALAQPPSWAPAYGWRAKHHYRYYPSAEVYYAPVRRLWFWLGHDGWRAGVSLPEALRGYVRAGGVNVFLDVDRPYLRNEYVVRRYGGHHRHWWRDHDHNDWRNNDNGHHHGYNHVRDDDDHDSHRWQLDHRHHGDDDDHHHARDCDDRDAHRWRPDHRQHGDHDDTQTDVNRPGRAPR